MMNLNKSQLIDHKIVPAFFTLSIFNIFIRYAQNLHPCISASICRS